mgnify:CR=1 FL=1
MAKPIIIKASTNNRRKCSRKSKIFSVCGIYLIISTYGNLATIVIIMLWLYMCIYIIMIGAYVNRYFEPVYHFFSYYRETVPRYHPSSRHKTAGSLPLNAWLRPILLMLPCSYGKLQYPINAAPCRGGKPLCGARGARRAGEEESALPD